MVHTAIEEDVAEQGLHGLPPQVERKTAIAPPMKGHRPTAVRDDKAECREVCEEVRQQRVLPIAARRIGIQVAADKPECFDAQPKLGNAVGRRYTGRLRELANTHEIVRKERADAMDQIVAELGPGQTGLLIAEMVGHLAGNRRKQGEVAAAFSLQLQLPPFNGGPNFVISDYEIGFLRRFQGIADRFQLLLAPRMKGLWRRCEMSVTVNNHWSVCGGFLCDPTSLRDRRKIGRAS